jgi:hypothetical protein
MSKKPRRLKVFQAAFGFHESVVAAPSQVAALAIWGARQNLFAEGQAHVTTDAAAVAAALKHPETPLRRAVGSNDPFVLDPADASPPKVPRAPTKPAAAEPKRAAKQKPVKPRPADRSALTAAEAVLRRLQSEQEDEQRELERRQAALDKEAAAARRRFGKACVAAERALERARAAFIAAGGTVSR